MKLLTDEMLPPAIAEGLRELGHDAVCAHERVELASSDDASIFAATQVEERAIATNNVRDFMVLATAALQTDAPFAGLVLTSDRSLPRGKNTMGTFIRLFHALLEEHPSDDGLSGQIRWLTP